MVWRVVEHMDWSVISVQDFDDEDDALEYKADYDRNHCHPCWASIHYCNRDDVAYYSNA